MQIFGYAIVKMLLYAGNCAISGFWQNMQSHIRI